MIPFSPAHATFTTIPLARFINSNADTSISLESQLGAEAYYLSVVSGADLESRPVVATRFGKVSVAQPASTEIAGIGRQSLLFLEGTNAPHASGAPVFLRSGENAVLWGIVDASVSDASSPFVGLIGVLPASAIAETVQAMAAVQEQKR